MEPPKFDRHGLRTLRTEASATRFGRLWNHQNFDFRPDLAATAREKSEPTKVETSPAEIRVWTSILEIPRKSPKTLTTVKNRQKKRPFFTLFRNFLSLVKIQKVENTRTSKASKIKKCKNTKFWPYPTNFETIDFKCKNSRKLLKMPFRQI